MHCFALICGGVVATYQLSSSKKPIGLEVGHDGLNIMQQLNLFEL